MDAKQDNTQNDTERLEVLVVVFETVNFRITLSHFFWLTRSIDSPQAKLSFVHFDP
jgi:hypothetical protein